MRYFKWIGPKHGVDWVIVTDDAITKYRKHSSSEWTEFDEPRWKTLKEMWTEITKEEAFLIGL